MLKKLGEDTFGYVQLFQFFIQTMDVVYIVHPLAYISAQITKKGVKFY
jgi:hypothetical protein